MKYNIPFEDIKIMIFKEVNRYSQGKEYCLRKGQTIYNATRNLYPKLLEENILGTKKDCFFLDENIPAFWEQLEKNWQTMQDQMKNSLCGTCFYSFYTGGTGIIGHDLSCLKDIRLENDSKECSGYLKYTELMKKWL